MDKALRIEGSADTPHVFLDSTSQIFKIHGRSMPEDATKFYKRVVTWVRNYAKEPNPTTIFEIDLEYFNSSTVKQLLSILLILESMANEGKEVKVIWYYEKEDELMEMKGQEIKSLVDILFILKIKD